MQFKRGTAARWAELNPILDVAEPGFEYDTKRFKIGDGKTPWLELHYIGGVLHCVNTFSELPAIGDPDTMYRVISDRVIYQWNIADKKYESLSSGGSFNPNEIKLITGGKANV